MNDGQKKFYTFFMNMVIPGKENEAKEALELSFTKQNNGTFDKAYLESIMPYYFSLVKPEYHEQLQKAMQHFSTLL